MPLGNWYKTLVSEFILCFLILKLTLWCHESSMHWWERTIYTTSLQRLVATPMTETSEALSATALSGPKRSWTLAQTWPLKLSICLVSSLVFVSVSKIHCSVFLMLYNYVHLMLSNQWEPAPPGSIGKLRPQESRAVRRRCHGS